MRSNGLGPRPACRGDLSAWYSAALVAQAASGLSVADYAMRIGVAAPTLYQWRRRLANERPQAAASSAGCRGLVEVVVGRGAAADGADPMVVRLGADRRIELPRGFDDDELRRLVALLESC